MTHPLLPAWASVPRPVIGMLHLPPLPGDRVARPTSQPFASLCCGMPTPWSPAAYTG